MKKTRQAGRKKSKQPKVPACALPRSKPETIIGVMKKLDTRFADLLQKTSHFKQAEMTERDAVITAVEIQTQLKLLQDLDFKIQEQIATKNQSRYIIETCRNIRDANQQIEELKNGLDLLSQLPPPPTAKKLPQLRSTKPAQIKKPALSSEPTENAKLSKMMFNVHAVETEVHRLEAEVNTVEKQIKQAQPKPVPLDELDLSISPFGSFR